MIVLAIWLGCAEPVSLPPPKQTLDTTIGRVVQAGTVKGYIARPTTGTPHTAVLLLVEQDDPSSHKAADEHAEAGAVVLAIEPSVPSADAHAYLSAIPNIQSVKTQCRRSHCP